jgi:4a-hydroxytetrahydrobiopterin dehydratase
MERLTATEFNQRTDLPDWRQLLGAIETTFRAGDFAKAAALVDQIASAANAANHHPDIDLRYPDRVHVTLTTHSARGLTTADADMAKTISALALAAGATSEPSAPMRVEVAIDALDIDLVRPFWQALLGYVEEKPSKPGAQIDAIRDPTGVGPAFWFQQMDAPRPQRNRIHLDVTVPHDIADQRVAAALDAGGHLVTAEYARSFWVLADPEGNEACICTWQDRD